MRTIAVAGIALAVLFGWSASSDAEVIVSPSSGPPGTVITVSGITACEGPRQPTLTFTLHGGSLGFAFPFTPPSGTVVVPDVPDGEYIIVPNCGAMEAFYVFVVTPAFTG